MFVSSLFKKNGCSVELTLCLLLMCLLIDTWPIWYQASEKLHKEDSIIKFIYLVSFAKVLGLHRLSNLIIYWSFFIFFLPSSDFSLVNYIFMKSIALVWSKRKDCAACFWDLSSSEPLTLAIIGYFKVEIEWKGVLKLFWILRNIECIFW